MIDAQEVHDTFVSCLFEDKETIENPVEVEGIMARYGFKSEKLETTRDKVKGWLEQLPESFFKDGGGGMSFLNACMTRNDEHWGEHPSVEKLLVLGMALGYVQCLAPREMWSMLPGGMPYYLVDLG